MSTARFLTLALVVVASACGSDGGSRVTATSSTTEASRAAEATFCAGWAKAIQSESDGPTLSLLRDAPREIAGAAAVLRASKTADKYTGDTEAAINEVTRWVEVNCNASSKQRHVAPPADARLPGLTLCSAGTPPVPPREARDEHAALYGEAGRSDPYDGPMLGVFTTKVGQGDYRGDGDPTAVVVRGKEGTAAPITVFQQVVLPALGTVITWSEAGHDVGLFGRLWPQQRTDELVALANRLELVDGQFVLPAGARPGGYEQVFVGPTDDHWSIIGTTIGGDYQVRYQGDAGAGGLVTVTGLRLTAPQFDTFRFFAFPIAHTRIGDHDARFGSLWSEHDGPYVATWREPDNFTVRISGVGASRAQVSAVAEQSRDLDRAEWVKLVKAAQECKLEPT